MKIQPRLFFEGLDKQENYATLLDTNSMEGAMSIVITKTKVKPKTKAAVETDLTQVDLSILADTYGDLHDKVQALKMDPTLAQFDLVSKTLTKRLADYDPAEPITLTGEHYVLDIGPCRHKPAEVVDMAAVEKMLGKATFLKLVTITLENLRKYLNPEQLAQVLNEDTGYSETRKITPKYLGG